MGSSVGTIAENSMKLKKVLTISDQHKFEGITLYRKSDKSLEFLLCEDQDNDGQEAQIFKLTITK